jgi:type VI protein secretion system component VasK
MKDEKLSEVLTNLPREGASEDFTHRVLQRIQATAGDEIPPQRRHLRQLQWAALALAICLALAGTFWSQQKGQAKTRALADGLAALQMETAALKAEIEALRQIKNRAQPTMYLGGSDTLGVILDLSRLSTASADSEGTYSGNAYTGGEIRPRPAATGKRPGHHL